ncbi:MAG: hypothetical protein IJ790_01595 [Lachnospiraceae bacterium]|nr:hypothetical protein [Lachnospiraceae bacterium]MBR1844405.1 hypothetical protein [Lachnospiraceae bacterium]
MIKHRIKNLITITVLILLYGTEVFAAPKVKENPGPMENQRMTEAKEIRETQEPKVIQETQEPKDIQETQEFTLDLDLPEQVLNSPDKSIDKTTYDEASKVIRRNINVVNNQIKNYTDYKDSVNEKIAKFSQGDDLDALSDEDRAKVKDLIKQLPQKTTKEKVVAADGSISTLTKNEEYYKALDKLNNTLKSKQSQLAEIESTIGLWQQIDALID